MSDGVLCGKLGEPGRPEAFRQALRALRNEYAVRRRMMLRIFPAVYEDEGAGLKPVLFEEGFREQKRKMGERTLLLDLRPSAQDLRKNFLQKWRNCLNQAEKNRLEVVEGEEDEIFGMFIGLYRELVKRKKFRGARRHQRVPADPEGSSPGIENEDLPVPLGRGLRSGGDLRRPGGYGDLPVWSDESPGTRQQRLLLTPVANHPVDEGIRMRPLRPERHQP